MKKNILMFINGFGIEQNGSYNIYKPELMPNLDELTKKTIFMTIPNNFLEYKAAYRKFSMGIDDALTHNVINREINELKYSKNPLLLYMINELNKHESNCHIICLWDSKEVSNEIIPYIREIEEKTKGKIFLHFILNQKSINDYKSISEGLFKLSYEFGQRIKMGIVTGENTLHELLPFKEFMKCFLTEAGEKWKDVEKKMEVFYQNETAPINARTFAINYGCRVEEKDQILFFNYSSINITDFKKELKEQKYRKFDSDTLGIYSLFPLECDVKVPFMYNYALSSDYFLNSLINANLKCLVIDTKEKCVQTNYYLTGLRNEINENLKYVPADDTILYDEAKLVETLNTHDKDIYIINYEIDSCKTVEELKERLSKIDKFVGVLSKYAKDNNCGLFISSLYGLERKMYNAKAEICKINFYSKVPVIIQDENLDLNSYALTEGNMYELSNTLIFNSNKEYKHMGLLKKKSKLFSFLYKKPKNNSLKERKVVTIENGKVQENGIENNNVPVQANTDNASANIQQETNNANANVQQVTNNINQNTNNQINNTEGGNSNV